MKNLNADQKAGVLMLVGLVIGLFIAMAIDIGFAAFIVTFVVVFVVGTIIIGAMLISKDIILEDLAFWRKWKEE